MDSIDMHGNAMKCNAMCGNAMKNIVRKSAEKIHGRKTGSISAGCTPLIRHVARRWPLLAGA